MAIQKILVVGATGKSGAAIIAEAQRRSIGVVAYARNPAKAKGLPPTAQVVIGDGLDAGALEPALEGVDAVVVSAGGVKDPVSGEIVETLIPLMKARGVHRLVALSAYGAVDGRGFYGWMLRTVGGAVPRDKVRMETALRASGLDWTAVRPGILTDKAATGAAVASAEDKVLKGLPQIPRADVAAFILDELQNPRFIGRAMVLSV